MNIPPYSPDLAPNNFHVFEPIKVDPEGQKFQTYDELKCGVLNRLCSQDRFFHSTGSSNLPEQ
jgi:hypothetical protein